MKVLDPTASDYVVPLDVDRHGESRSFRQVGVHHVLKREEVDLLNAQVRAVETKRRHGGPDGNQAAPVVALAVEVD